MYLIFIDYVQLNVKKNYFNYITKSFILLQLPDVTATLQNVSSLMENDIENEVIKGRDEFEKVQTSIQKSVDTNIPIIRSNIKKAGKYFAFLMLDI